MKATLVNPRRRAATGVEVQYRDGTIATALRGYDVLHTPLVNKGTAFTAQERVELGLTGLLPPSVKTLEQQAERAYRQYTRQPDDLGRNRYLASLHDRNEVLFYHLVSTHLREMLPIVYTPTVAQAIQEYSHEYRRPRGLFLSIDHPEDVKPSFRNLALGREDVDLIVATDGERILGIGDWGVGGIDISIGKLAVYTAAAGIHPERVIPVVLDVGTDRQELLEDEQYLGNRHARIRGERYDEFIDLYVHAALEAFPHALLHWEDFGADNARRLLDRYRERCCTFNDDLQGTGAVGVAAVKSALRITGGRIQDQRIVLFGCGTAGVGIAEQLTSAMVAEGLSQSDARSRFWGLGRRGLMTEALAAELRYFQRPFARPNAEVCDWDAGTGSIGIEEVVRRVQPTVLIGASTVPRAFTETVVRQMAAGVKRPIILPMTNPTDRSEAVPEDLIEWTDGRALIATGSPFAPVTYRGVKYAIGQANNAFVFPGIGLGVIAIRASRVSDGMLAAAADAVVAMTDVTRPGASLLPDVGDLREVSVAVATAVAREAMAEGIAREPHEHPERVVRAAMWEPVYRLVIASRL